jgi:type II restriction/modification system DNA methylase subunit YeeA
MDVNRFTRIGVVSPAPGQFQPEILAEAKAGHIDEGTMPDKTRQKIFALLDGSAPSPDPQGEAYRLLVVATCNDWNKAMPFLFEKIADFTELLMPDDLLSGNSILAYTREAMTPDACEDVEVIGWLYQFYISEKKDEVFDGLKKNKKITPENIPAATQLFTPHWIVRYLVENSLGRLWMLNRPNSKLTERMDYYIAPDNQQPATEYLRVSSPEEIRICDPACGSGHMLTYAFDLLYAIYEEEGYESTEIPEKIITHNLYGIEIDERAGELAAFALTMKARAKQRRFFSKQIKPNICVLKNVKFEDGELKSYMDEVGRDLFSAPLQTTLRQFEEADNFGSLIIPEAKDVAELKRLLDAKDMGGNLLLHPVHRNVLQALEMADFLSPKYHVVIANPPYMGNGGMNARLATWAKSRYPDSKSDLYAMFIERNLKLSKTRGLVSMITMQGWMFLSRFEKLRVKIISESTILSMSHLGTRGFDSIGGEVVSTTAFVVQNQSIPSLRGDYLRLVDGECEAEKEAAIKSAIRNKRCGYSYNAAASDFKKIPGNPIAYWVSDVMVKSFGQKYVGDYFLTREGMATADNDRFLRNWSEICFKDLCLDVASEKEALAQNGKWFPYNKGGEFRKWFGNNDLIVDFGNDGYSIKNNADPKTGRIRSHNYNGEYAFKEGLTWSAISSGTFSIRFSPKGFLFDSKGAKGFSAHPFEVLAFLNSNVSNLYLKILSPTLDYKVGDVIQIPFDLKFSSTTASQNAERAVCISRRCWDAYETSWEFTILPLLQPDYRFQTLEKTYAALSNHWKTMTLEMQRLEEENNRIFIDAYGLQDELTPDVPFNEITLTCNPYYRYSKAPADVPHSTSDFPLDTELEERLLADTMREFISYAVGCMFGRYSLDKPGLILANQGETLADYLKQIPQPSFPADDDNVIPMLDGDWFTDDISERFRKFLRVTFGEEHYETNLRFIEEALGKDIQKYFLKDFYGDHVKRYKKRPIYWMFSSPKGSFNALIYMHRYRPDTVSVVLNDYLREFRTKLSSKLDHLREVERSADVAKGEKAKALKTIESLRKILAELDDYERETLYPLATKQLEIDLDDGVKVNYLKFGSALKKIAGLEEKED